jgi:hypothetical protein
MVLSSGDENTASIRWRVRSSGRRGVVSRIDQGFGGHGRHATRDGLSTGNDREGRASASANSACIAATHGRVAGRTRWLKEALAGGKTLEELAG